MKSVRNLKVILPLAGVLLLAGAAGYTVSRVTSEPVASVAEDGGFRFRFPPGSVYSYDLTLDTDQTLTPNAESGKTVTGRLHLVGTLRLRSYGQHEGRTRLGIALPTLREHELVFQGSNLLAGDVAPVFGEREAIVEISDRGQVHKVWYAKDCPEVFRSVLDSVIPAIAATAPEHPGPMWTADEATPFGRAETFYSESDGPLSYARNRSSYTQLHALSGPVPVDTSVSGHTTVVLDPAGHLASLDAEESLTVGGEPSRFAGTLAVHLKKTAVERFKMPKLALAEQFEAAEPGQAHGATRMQRKLWQNMVGSMTLTDVEVGLAAYALQGHKPAEGWMTKSMLLLRLNPSYAARLADLFEKPGMTPRGRSMICDLLASAGTAEAQAAMRDALSGSLLRGDADYPVLLQRFSFVKQPTPETMAYLEQALAGAPNEGVRLAAALSLGAATGRMAASGQDVSAYNHQLLEGLKTAETAKQRDAMVDALGNAGLEENIPVLAKLTEDEDPSVRLSVARALRKTDSPAARDVLFGMLRDADASVGLASLQTLGEQTMDRESMDRLETMATGPGFNTQLDGQLVTLLSKRPSNEGARARMLDAILARTTDPRTAARVRMIRGG